MTGIAASAGSALTAAYRSCWNFSPAACPISPAYANEAVTSLIPSIEVMPPGSAATNVFSRAISVATPPSVLDVKLNLIPAAIARSNGNTAAGSSIPPPSRT